MIGGASRRVHVRREVPTPEYLRALALANQAAQWVSSHASRPPTRWAPRDLALGLALSLMSLSLTLLCISCCFLLARRLATMWRIKRRHDKAGGVMGARA